MNNAPKDYYISTSTDPSSETFSVGSSFTLPYNINGAGLNIKDSFLYCATYVGADNTVGNNLGVSPYRVETDGNYVDLGLLPTTGQTSIEFVNFSAGTMNEDGTYCYMTFGLKPSGVIKIFLTTGGSTAPDLESDDTRAFICWLDNVDTFTFDPVNNAADAVTGYYEIDFSNADVTAALDAFLDEVNANYPDVHNADGGIQDIDINPADGLMYGYISYPKLGQHRRAACCI